MKLLVELKLTKTNSVLGVTLLVNALFKMLSGSSPMIPT